jgi:hypothetical protein
MQLDRQITNRQRLQPAQQIRPDRAVISVEPVVDLPDTGAEVMDRPER